MLDQNQMLKHTPDSSTSVVKNRHQTPISDPIFLGAAHRDQRRKFDDEKKETPEPEDSSVTEAQTDFPKDESVA